MKPLRLLVSLGAAAATVYSSDPFSSTTAPVYIQSIGPHSSPITLLAEIQYDSSSLSAEYASYDAPELPSEAKFVRVGIYDAATQSWKSSTSVTSARSFSRGYSPIIILSLDSHSAIAGVTVKSVKIDAGHTRDFGPKVKLVDMTTGKRPDLNRPIVVTTDGAVEGEVPEKTMLQKYWWVAAGAMVILLATGGGDK